MLKQVVPIPMIEIRCQKGCCTVLTCPLQLAFGMTLHTFQGQSAGPVEEGQPPNAVDRVILEPGTRQFEGNNPGTLYTAASRGTTAGTGNLDSAIYFRGMNMNRARVMNMTKQRDGKTTYKKVALRDKWIKHLENHTVKPKRTDEIKKELLLWCKEFKMSKQELDEALSRRPWRSNMMKATSY